MKKENTKFHTIMEEKSTDAMVPISLETMIKSFVLASKSKYLAKFVKYLTGINCELPITRHPRLAGGADSAEKEEAKSELKEVTIGSASDKPGCFDNWENIIRESLSYENLCGRSIDARFEVEVERKQLVPNIACGMKNSIMFANLPQAVDNFVVFGKNNDNVGLELSGTYRWDESNNYFPSCNDLLSYNEKVSLGKRGNGLIRMTKPSKTMYKLPISDNICNKIVGVDTLVETSKIWRSIFGGKDDQASSRVAASMLMGSGRTDNHMTFLFRAWSYYFSVLSCSASPFEMRNTRAVAPLHITGLEAKDWQAKFVTSNHTPVRTRSQEMDYIHFLATCCVNGRWSYESFHRTNVGDKDSPEYVDHVNVYSRSGVLTMREMVLVSDSQLPPASYNPLWLGNAGVISSYIVNYCRESGIMNQVFDAYLLAGILPFFPDGIHLPEPVHSADAFVGMLEEESPVNEALYSITEANPIGNIVGFYLYAKSYEASWDQMVSGMLAQRSNEFIDPRAMMPVTRLLALDSVSLYRLSLGLPKLFTNDDYFFLSHTDLNQLMLSSITRGDFIKQRKPSVLAGLLLARYHTDSIVGLLREPKVLQDTPLIGDVAMSSGKQFFLKTLLNFDTNSTIIRPLEATYYKRSDVSIPFNVAPGKIRQMLECGPKSCSLVLVSVGLTNKAKDYLSDLDRFDGMRTKLLAMFTASGSAFNDKSLEEKKAEDESRAYLAAQEEKAELARSEMELPDPDSPTFRKELDQKVEKLFPIPSQTDIQAVKMDLDEREWVPIECGGDGDCGPKTLNWFSTSIGCKTSERKIRNAVARDLGYRPKNGSWFHEVDMMAAAKDMNVGLVYDTGAGTEPHVAIAGTSYIYVRNVGNHHWQLMVQVAKAAEIKKKQISQPIIVGNPAHKGAAGGDSFFAEEQPSYEEEVFSGKAEGGTASEKSIINSLLYSLPAYKSMKKTQKHKLRSLAEAGVETGVDRSELKIQLTEAAQQDFHLENSSGQRTIGQKNQCGEDNLGVSQETCLSGSLEVGETITDTRPLEKSITGIEEVKSVSPATIIGSRRYSQKPHRQRRSSISSDPESVKEATSDQQTSCLKETCIERSSRKEDVQAVESTNTELRKREVELCTSKWSVLRRLFSTGKLKIFYGSRNKSIEDLVSEKSLEEEKRT